MGRLLKNVEQTVDEKLTIAEVYASRPRKWVLYTAIVLILAVLVGWSASGVNFTGVTSVGAEVAKGVFYGIFNPDRALLCRNSQRRWSGGWMPDNTHSP